MLKPAPSILSLDSVLEMRVKLESTFRISNQKGHAARTTELVLKANLIALVVTLIFESFSFLLNLFFQIFPFSLLLGN